MHTKLEKKGVEFVELQKFGQPKCIVKEPVLIENYPTTKLSGPVTLLVRHIFQNKSSFKFIDPILSFANKDVMEYSKSFTNTFLTQCIVRLGLIYCGLASLVFIFVEYKIASGFWWMNGLVFALADVKTALLCFSILIAFVFGFYCWVSSEQRHGYSLTLIKCPTI